MIVTTSATFFETHGAHLRNLTFIFTVSTTCRSSPLSSTFFYLTFF